MVEWKEKRKQVNDRINRDYRRIEDLLHPSDNLHYFKGYLRARNIFFAYMGTFAFLVLITVLSVFAFYGVYSYEQYWGEQYPGVPFELTSIYLISNIMFFGVRVSVIFVTAYMFYVLFVWLTAFTKQMRLKREGKEKDAHANPNQLCADLKLNQTGGGTDGT